MTQNTTTIHQITTNTQNQTIPQATVLYILINKMKVHRKVHLKILHIAPQKAINLTKLNIHKTSH